MRPTIASIVVLAWVVAAPSGAQEPVAAGGPERELARIEPGTLLRVRTSEPTRLVGAFERVDGGALHVREDEGARVIDLAAIDTLWVRDRAGRRGFAIGAALGVAVVAGVCIDTLDECGLVPGIPLVPLVVGGFGAVAGNFFRQWHRRYP